MVEQPGRPFPWLVGRFKLEVKAVSKAGQSGNDFKKTQIERKNRPQHFREVLEDFFSFIIHLCKV